jgi:hypothetical protein
LELLPQWAFLEAVFFGMPEVRLLDAVFSQNQPFQCHFEAVFAIQGRSF